MKLLEYKITKEKEAERSKTWYFETPDLPNTHLKVEVYYEEGGMNYFSGSSKARGYYIMVKPVDIVDNGSYQTESMALFGAGGYDIIEEAKRFGRKQLDRVIENAQAKLDEVTPIVMNQINLSGSTKAGQ